MKLNRQILKTGFQNSFWVANGMELFERLAYYGQAAVLSIFLRDFLKFNEVETGSLSSIFGGLIYSLPIFAGALADKFGFKKAFSFAFLVLGIGYLSIGLTGILTDSSLYGSSQLYYLLISILVLTAIGGSFIKPSVLGTVALTTTTETKSFGYAIYYWLVNIGGALGPLIAVFVRTSIGIQYVYIVSSISCLLMLIITLSFYKEPVKSNKQNISIRELSNNFIKVITNFRFMIFLLIFSLYWLMFWQIFIIVPFFIKDYVSVDAPFELIISAGSWSIIVFQLFINWLTKGLKTINAIVLGFILSSIAWIIFIISNNNIIYTGIDLKIILLVLGIIMFSFGEQTQAPRYYEYISDLAPEGQAGLFQGFAFLPIAIGYFFGGYFGGWLYTLYGIKGLNKPEMIFSILLAIGLFMTLTMIFYNYFIVKKNRNN